MGQSKVTVLWGYDRGGAAIGGQASILRRQANALDADDPDGARPRVIYWVRMHVQNFDPMQYFSWKIFLAIAIFYTGLEFVLYLIAIFGAHNIEQRLVYVKADPPGPR